MNNPLANLDKTINSKESPAKAKTKILVEEDKGKQFKTDHLEKLPKPNLSHVGSTAAAKPSPPPLYFRFYRRNHIDNMYVRKPIKEEYTFETDPTKLLLNQCEHKILPNQLKMSPLQLVHKNTSTQIHL